MKKLLLIFMASCGAYSLMAQTDDTTMNRRKNFTHDRDLSRWVIDINFLGGGFSQNFTTGNTYGNYLNEINSVSNTGNLKFTNGSVFGGDAQIGYFFGKNKHWGIGTGFMYLYQQGDAVLDNYHVEYQATDKSGATFRQLITGDQVKEHITTSNMNIPLVLKYKNRFSKHWGFTGDIGALFNLQMKNSYNNNKSAFDYEAIYAYNTEGGNATAVYDASPVPGGNDVLYTKAFIQAHLTAPNTVQTRFDQLQAEGYNVGLGVRPAQSTGNVSYTTPSVGLLVQPSINYFFSDKVALNVGLFYIYQPFKNDAESNYTLTSAVGGYNSVMNNVTKSNTQDYGANVGLRFFLGGHKAPESVRSVDNIAPTLCGNCDGLMTIHGLKPGKEVKVNYNYNSAPQAEFKAKVDANGNVIIRNLCAGSYTNITAKIHKHTIAATSVNIDAPVLAISSENSTNPTANGQCDGTITFNGLYAGKQVMISYNLNGTKQTGYNGVVNSDNTVTLTGLCAGTYSGIVATIGSCTANGQDVTLTAPAPPPPPPAPTPVAERPDISQPILFNFNKSTVHKTSVPLIEEAAEEMKADPNAVITVNGYTDAIGSKAYNKKLSIRRAMAVKNHLKKYGVSPKRVKIVGHGKSDPAATNKTPEGRAENRRAIMDLEDKDGNTQEQKVNFKSNK